MAGHYHRKRVRTSRIEIQRHNEGGEGDQGENIPVACRARLVASRHRGVVGDDGLQVGALSSLLIGGAVGGGGGDVGGHLLAFVEDGLEIDAFHGTGQREGRGKDRR